MTTRQRWAFAAAIIVLAVLSSWNGVYNDFTYDDIFIVRDNDSLHHLGNWWRFFGSAYWPKKWGAEGYRPLTILMYSVEWAAGQGKPWVFHLTNIVLYACISASVFFLAEASLPFAAAFVAAALFAVHPLHVEAVGSVVGQSELLVAVFAVPAITLYIRSRNANALTPWRMAAIAVLYLLACLSKEHGVVLPAILVAAELTVVQDKTPIRARIMTVRPFMLGLMAAGVMYLWVHAKVTSEQLTGFHPYVPFRTLQLDTSGRALTMFGLVPQWIRLFFWPQHLSSEYSPPEFPVVSGFHAYQLPGMIILAAIIGLGFFGLKRAPAVAFGVAITLFAILPTSNFIVPSGILLAERTLFLPSVGAMIALGAIVPWLYRKVPIRSLQLAGVAIFVALVAAGAWRSFQRTKIWKTNDDLFAQAVIDAPDTYRAHFMLAAWKFHIKRKADGEREYQKAMALYDRDPFVYYGLAEEYRQAGIFQPAISLLQKSMVADTSFVDAQDHLAVIYYDLERWNEARATAFAALGRNTHSVVALRAVIHYSTDALKREAAGGVTPRTPAIEPDSGQVKSALQKTGTDRR